jgi:2-polyprenyl-3-methyl-5-hydroxy-6-metoxy-1,4-benzoquinol methylase
LKGVLGPDYHWKRLTKHSHRYRLWRRTFEVHRAIRRFRSLPELAILDIGTADGLTLGYLQSVFRGGTCFGLDYSLELLRFSQGINPTQGDALNLPYAAGTFDVVVATAVIEHVPQPKQMLQEIHRVLRSAGLVIISTPHPFFEKIATLMGHLDKDEHQVTINLSTLKMLILESELSVLEAKRFMVSPVGVPFEIQLERVLETIGLDWFFMNQLIVGSKP